MTTKRQLMLAFPVVLTGWIAVLAVAMRLSGAAPAALVVLPPDSLMDALPPGVSILAAGSYSVTFKGDKGLVAALYHAGALLVLPAGLTGCLPQTAI